MVNWSGVKLVIVDWLHNAVFNIYSSSENWVGQAMGNKTLYTYWVGLSIAITFYWQMA